MKHKILIENREDQYIILDYDILKNEIKFIGKYKPKNKESVDIIIITKNIDECLDYEIILDTILKVSLEINNRIEKSRIYQTLISDLHLVEIKL